MGLIGGKVATLSLLQTVSLGTGAAPGGGGVLVPGDKEGVGSKAVRAWLPVVSLAATQAIKTEAIWRLEGRGWHKRGRVEEKEKGGRRKKIEMGEGATKA